MKILSTQDFISERMKVKPVTNAEWDETKQEILKIMKKRLERVKLDKRLLRYFGYVVEVKDGTCWITLGDTIAEPDYVKEYRKLFDVQEELSYPLMIIASDQSMYDWSFVEICYYDETFPKYGNNVYLDIVAMYKLPIEPKDIDTLDGLNAVYEKYKLKNTI